jgi:hypothetical protein
MFGASNHAQLGQGREREAFHTAQPQTVFRDESCEEIGGGMTFSLLALM